MSEDVHQRAERLLAASKVEGITEADREWLDAHLEGCAPCARLAASVEHVVASLRSVSLPLDPAVVEATRRRVHARALELREHDARMRALWMSCALSWMLGAVSAPLLWRGLEWVGQRMALPESVQVVAFIFWWIVPAVVVAAVLTWRRSRALAQNGYGRGTH
ncbi:MAG: hypothetical protein HYS61_03030 [Acidobacteria bacterium]|nr:hypothetical protein [Acidobacteriota bacterium]